MVKIHDNGIMLSDYFSGTSGVMLPISIDNKSTYRDVIEMLEREIDMVFDHIEYTAQSKDYPTDNLWEEIEKEINTIKMENKHKLNQVFDPTLDFSFESIEEDIELPILILTIEFK